MMNLLGFIRPGFWEMITVLLIVLLLFGPKRLPQVGSAIGEAIRGLRKSLKGDEENEKKENEGK